MHGAPSVAYPVGRCAFQKLVFGALCLAVLVAELSWLMLQALSGWMVLSWICVAIALAIGTSSIRETGVLTWDGRAWCLSGLGRESEWGQFSVSFDLQETLLLQWQSTSILHMNRSRWLWLAKEQAPMLWLDLRRAVYQRQNID